ncbi:MAG: PKD domain-containing protein [Thermoplasmata archaeon]|nr:PKD domain-containing protein [Thermoplasmata archaeon]
MLIVPVSTVMIFEPKILGIGNIEPDFSDDDIAPISTMHSPRIFVFFYNELWDCRGVPYPIINVSWHGEDNPRGSGIKWYDVQFMSVTIDFESNAVHPAEYPPDPSWYNPVERSEWQDWQAQTTNTSAEFELEPDCIYIFRCRATDNDGNVEAWPESWDTYTVSIGIKVPPELTDELRGELEGGIERIQTSHYESLNYIKKNPKDELLELINGITSNTPPVADAGGNYSGGIDKTPRIYEDAKDAVNDIDPHRHYAEVEFNGSGSYDLDGEIIEYLWDFGDGGYGHGVCASHKYAVPGEYNVTLTVTDNYGATDQDTIVCTIGVMC